MMGRRRAAPDATPEADMHFLVVDSRFGTPVYAFLERDPRGQAGYPGFTVREVSLEAGATASRRPAIGRDPARLERFCEFASEAALARAGFILIEPRYVGPNWEGYCCQFRPEGEKPIKRPVRVPAAVPRD
jgi:hypothetical protein